MDKTRKIRTKNTLLAASGAVLLSLELLFAYWMQAVTVSGNLIACILIIFWLINIVFIWALASGASERFRDPSLSVAQMYWATTTSLASLLLMPSYAYLVYFLLFVIAIFGVFRLKPRAYDIYAVFQSTSFAVVLMIQYHLGLTSYANIDLFATWIVFVCCISILIVLCRSVSALRGKLRAKNMQLQEALNARSQFLANMSHELRTPMNGVLGMLELLERTELQAEQVRFVNVARSSGQSLLVLISDILDFSKIEAKKLELHLESFGLKKVSFEFVQAFYFLAVQKGLDFIIDIDPSLPDSVIGDENRIRQILNNVVGNALKFTSSGSIIVSVNKGEETNLGLDVIFSVRDTGCGISTESQKHVFESFSQADNSTTRTYGGTGLGLAISKKLCEIMGGDITLNSDVNAGSEFQFNLKVEPDSSALTLANSVIDKRVLVVDICIPRARALERMLTFLGCEAELITNEDISVNDIFSRVVEGVFTSIVMHESAGGVGVEDSLHRKLSKLAGSAHLSLIHYGSGNSDLDNDSLLSEPASIENLVAVLLAESTFSNLKPVDNDGVSIGESGPNAKPVIIEQAKVLLVEDNPTNRDVAIMLIEDCAIDVEVVVAEHGGEALEILANKKDFRLIFMDCQMPVKDGYTTTQEIRAGAAGEAYRAIPIVAMTANVLVGDREKCIEAGMNDYISKPISFDGIEQCLNNWLSSP